MRFKASTQGILGSKSIVHPLLWTSQSFHIIRKKTFLFKRLVGGHNKIQGVPYYFAKFFFVKCFRQDIQNYKSIILL